MDNSKKNVRKMLLKPLRRRPYGNVNQKALIEALRNIENQAYGEHLLSQLRPALREKNIQNKKSLGNPKEARETIGLAKILYVARRISTQQYLFFAVAPVESVHEKRMLDGKYSEELDPILKKIRHIEAQYGLKDDEYFQLDDAPEEYRLLNKEWEEVFDSKFVEVLREFDLDDLADMKLKEPERFDRYRERGRRAIFHKEEKLEIIKDIVIRSEEDARKAASAQAFFAAVISIGAAIEGLLILRCLESPIKARNIAKDLSKRIRPKFVEDPATWNFETLIKVCAVAKWLPVFETSSARVDSEGLAHLLRFLRNNVHPGRLFRERPWAEIDQRDYEDAAAIYKIILSTLRNKNEIEITI